MVNISVTDFLGSWASAINKEIKKSALPSDPRILNDPNAEYLVSYLPFDKSVSEDLCGNIWEVSGNPTISDGALYVNNFDKQGVLTMPSFTLGGQDFTIGFFGWLAGNTSTPVAEWGRMFSMRYLTIDITAVSIQQYRATFYYYLYLGSSDGAYSSYKQIGAKSKAGSGDWVYFEIDYTQSDGALRLFYDGVIEASITNHHAGVPRQNFIMRLLGDSGTGGTVIGYIDEFKIYDGVALHTADFTPPTRA